MSNIPNNIKKMWEEAAKIKKPEIGKIGGNNKNKPLHSGNQSIPTTGPKMVKYGEKGNLKN